MHTQWREAINGWKIWLQADGRPAESIAVQLSRINRLAAFYADRSPWDLDDQDLAAWLAAHTDWARSTRRGARSSLRTFYGWACAAKHLEANPAATLPATRPEAIKPRPVPDDIVRQALHAESDPRVVLMIRLARGLGIRRSEVAATRREDLYQLAGQWWIRVLGKGARERDIPVPADLVIAIRSMPAGYLFPSPAGGHLTPAHVGKLVRNSLPGTWTMHTLRHAYATAAFAATHDLTAVQKLMGHASIEITRRYILTPLDAVVLAAAGAQLTGVYDPRAEAA